MLALLAGPALAQEDLANERLPVSRAELERHWGVDCLAAVAGVRQALEAAAAGGRPGPGEDRWRDLESRLERCALLDRRAGQVSPRHAMLLQGLESWRGALAAGERCRERAARRALEELLAAEFDLGQGR